MALLERVVVVAMVPTKIFSQVQHMSTRQVDFLAFPMHPDFLLLRLK
jgi:hypothetical protein